MHSNQGHATLMNFITSLSHTASQRGGFLFEMLQFRKLHGLYYNHYIHSYVYCFSALM